MYRLWEKLGDAQVNGFSVLEWFGIAAIVLLFVIGAMCLLRRLFGLSPRFCPPFKNNGTPSGHPPAGKEKILIADDDPVVLEMMNRLLSNLGYQVVGVRSGEQAVQYVTNNGADLILLDALMEPGMDGVEACRQIRQLRPLQRVIMISGHASPERVAAIRNLGVEHYLIKPVPLMTLAQAIRMELDRP